MSSKHPNLDRQLEPHPNKCLVCSVKGKNGKPTARLEQWEFKEGDNVVGGLIHDDVDMRWRDDHWISTSQIVSMDDTHLFTLNSLYILGERSSVCQYCKYEPRPSSNIIPDDELSQAMRKCTYCQMKELKKIHQEKK